MLSGGERKPSEVATAKRSSEVTVLDTTVHRTVVLRAMASATGRDQSDNHTSLEESKYSEKSIKLFSEEGNKNGYHRSGTFCKSITVREG